MLYRVDSPAAAAQFDHPGYYNSCTMKSCCFGGPEDEFVISGSDDFNVYMWRVPGRGEEGWVGRAHHVLSGHRSIVNQVRYNHSRHLVATSGVEKVVKLWSVLPLPARDTALAGDRERRVFSHEEYIGLVMRSSGNMIGGDYSAASTSENPRMMAFFDSLVQREIEGWDTEDSGGSEAGGSEELHSAVASSEDEEAGTMSYTRRGRERAEHGAASEPELDLVLASPPGSGDHNSSLNTTDSRDDGGSSPLQDSSGLSLEQTQSDERRRSSQNVIADLIAKKRSQLQRRSRRCEDSAAADPAVVNKLLQSARRTLRSDSNNSDQSSSSSSSDSSLLSLSSILNRGSAESPPAEHDDGFEEKEDVPDENLPGTSSGVVKRQGSDFIRKLKKKKLQIIMNSDTESGSEKETNSTSNDKTTDCVQAGTRNEEVKFKKQSKGKQRNLRKKSSSDSDQ